MLTIHLDAQPGTYALLLQAKEIEHIQIGRLGGLHVQVGYYVYVGRALGSGGLRARVRRHARREKSSRWHVDYLRAVTDLVEVWCAQDTQRRECQWAALIAELPGASMPLIGFGSSDCRCPSHLYYFRGKRSLASFRRRVREWLPDHGRVQRMVTERETRC